MHAAIKGNLGRQDVPSWFCLRLIDTHFLRGPNMKQSMGTGWVISSFSNLERSSKLWAFGTPWGYRKKMCSPQSPGIQAWFFDFDRLKNPFRTQALLQPSNTQAQVSQFDFSLQCYTTFWYVELELVNGFFLGLMQCWISQEWCLQETCAVTPSKSLQVLYCWLFDRWVVHVDAIDAFVPQEKTIFYHKCKVEQYAPYTQDDGLIQRITLYKDHPRTERIGRWQIWKVWGHLVLKEREASEASLCLIDTPIPQI